MLIGTQSSAASGVCQQPQEVYMCDLLDVEQGAGFGFCVGLGMFGGNFKAISAGYCERL